MEKRNPLLAPFHPVDAYERLRRELYAYADSESPFKRPLHGGETVLQWWTKVQKDVDAKVLGALAIKIFSAVPHSMADERTMTHVILKHAAVSPFPAYVAGATSVEEIRRLERMLREGFLPGMDSVGA
ncbi:hypothetical protein NUW54_g3469 [Trametes sanguinea]|uniref:Uncharacterized protein n=1 Tax=Trametes sanguinea TaxID=158606 RepID=A0ACC1Q2U2_9APHY|nr:hypothetical protein NUW54_g3469 [Trametes sanguinea]